MSLFLANLVNQNIASGGAGIALTLDTAVDSFVTMQDAGVVNNDEFFYCIINGNNREVGYGRFNNPNTLTRLRLYQVINSGVYNATPGLGNAIDATLGTVAISPSLEGLTQHYPVWKHQFAHIMNTFNAYSGDPRSFPALTGSIGMIGLPDDGANDSIVDFTIACPSDVVPNTDIRFFGHFAPGTGSVSTDTADLQMAISHAKFGEIFSGEIISITENLVINDENRLQRLEFYSGGLAVKFEEPNQMFVGRLKRITEASGVKDTLGLLGISIMYQAKAIGTPGNGVDSAYYDWVNV